MAPQEEQGQGGGAVQAAVSKAEQLVTNVRTLVLSPGFSGKETVRVSNKYSRQTRCLTPASTLGKSTIHLSK